MARAGTAAGPMGNEVVCGACGSSSRSRGRDAGLACWSCRDCGSVTFDRSANEDHCHGLYEQGQDPPPRLRTSGRCVLELLDELVRPPGPVTSVILALELLEHLSDPGDLVGRRRDGWPVTPVIASVPSPSRRRVVAGDREEWDRPPEHLIRFTPTGLQRLFERHGHRAEVHGPDQTGRDLVPGWFKRTLAARSVLWGHAAYVGTGYLLGALRGRVAQRTADASAESMVVVAVPA